MDDRGLGTLYLSKAFRQDGPVALPDADWRRLAQLVKRRREQLGLTQAHVQASGGPSTATMRIIERAGQTSYRPERLARLEQILEWAPGSIAAILNGDDPTPMGGGPAPAPDISADRLTRAEAELSALRADLQLIRDKPNRSRRLRDMADAQLTMVTAQLAQIRALREMVQEEEQDEQDQPRGRAV